MDLAHNEYGDLDEATTYGPFASEEAVNQYLDYNFSNPGGYSLDGSGGHPAPKASPNGDPVINPGKLGKPGKF